MVLGVGFSRFSRWAQHCPHSIGCRTPISRQYVARKASCASWPNGHRCRVLLPDQVDDDECDQQASEPHCHDLAPHRCPICHVFVELREGLGRASPRALTSGALLEHLMMNDSPIVFAELVGSPLLTGDPESIIGHAVHSTHCWCAAGCWSPTLPTRSTKPASADGSCAAMRTDRPAA